MDVAFFFLHYFTIYPSHHSKGLLYKEILETQKRLKEQVFVSFSLIIFYPFIFRSPFAICLQVPVKFFSASYKRQGKTSGLILSAKKFR